MIMDRDSKRKREHITSDDNSSAARDYNIGDNRRGNNASGQGGRKTLSLDQSLFPSDASAKLTSKSAAPPEFSCSPIAIQSSQPEPDYDDDDIQQTTTASQLDTFCLASARKSSSKPPPPTSGKVQLEMAPSKPGSSCETRRTSISRPPSNQWSSRKNLSPRNKSRVSFQQQPRVMLLNPSWMLSNKHTRCLRRCANDGFISMLKLRTNDAFDDVDEFDPGFDFDTNEGRDSFLAMLSSNRTDSRPPAPLSFYAISTEKDENFSFGEAIIVPRSFPYYLAVACGLPIVDIEFISSAASMKRRGIMHHQRYPFPSLLDDKNETRGKKHSRKDCLVIGASNYIWDSPKKAHAAALDRHSLWQKEEGPFAHLETLLPGTDLLHEYVVLLLGEFDQPNHSKRTVAKRRKQRDSEIKGGGYCTRGNISLLLQLCGANVYDIDSVTASKHIKRGLTENQLQDIKNAQPSCRYGSQESGPTLRDALLSMEESKSPRKIIVMIKDKSEAKLGSEFLNHLHSVSSSAKNEILQIPVVSCQWLLDSVGEFHAQEIGGYNN